jgi:protein MpaA
MQYAVNPHARADNHTMQRLGINIGKYMGERIDIHRVLADVSAAATKNGWHSELFLDNGALRLTGLTRKSAASKRRIYLSTGIHGDEPAGPLAALQLLEDNRWPDADLWLCPCLNPTGFERGTRENAQGMDLNRQYLKPSAEETRAHIAWLERQPGFDVSLCLHEDWESQGFYLYELNLDKKPSLAEEIMRRVAEVCPVDPSPLIEGRTAAGGIIRPGLDPRSRPDWPEAFYLITYKSGLSYTLEAPSDFPLATRVTALVAGVRAVVDSL